MSEEYEEQLYKVDTKLLHKGNDPPAFDVLFLNCDYKLEPRISAEEYNSPSIYGYKAASKTMVFGKEMNVIKTPSKTLLKSCGLRPFVYESITEKLSRQQLSWYDSFEGTTPNKDKCHTDIWNWKLIATINSKHNVDTIFKMFVNEISGFILDLFFGCTEENLVMLHLLNLCRRIRVQSSNKSFSYAVLALICPRAAVTGHLSKNRSSVALRKNETFIVTADRRYSMRGSKKVIYANCLFSMVHLKPDEYIHIGDIVLRVIKKVRNSAECLVVRPGVLRPGMRVVFPCNIMVSEVSVEEVQDITFALGSEIDCLVLPNAGCSAYYDSIRNTMKLLRCSGFLFAIVTQNELCNEEYAKWVASTYDGVVLVVEKNLKSHQIIRFTKQTRSFIERCYANKIKIIISNFLPKQCGVKEIITVSPQDHKHFFYYPDSFLLGPNEFTDRHISMFNDIWCDIDARIEKYAQEDLAAPFTDTSHTGSDSVARAVVRLSYDINADAIIICTVSGRMAEKIAHFRPRCPIVAVMKDVPGFKHLEVVHNLRLALYIESDKAYEFGSKKNMDIYKKLFFGILYGLTFGIIKVNSNIIFAFRTIKNMGYPDKFLSFKINTKVIDIIFEHLK